MEKERREKGRQQHVDRVSGHRFPSFNCLPNCHPPISESWLIRLRMVLMNLSNPCHTTIRVILQSVSYYNPRPLILHGYLGPFVSIYGLLIYSWLSNTSTDPYDIWFLYLGIAVVFQVLAFLFCLWSVHVHCFLAYNKVIN